LDFVPWASTLAKTTGRPVIFECREDFEGYARQRRGIPHIFRPAAVRYARMLVRLGARSCDAVVVADEGTGQKLAPHARRLLLLYNFPRLELFSHFNDASEDKPYDIVLYGSLPKYHLQVCLAVDSALVKRGYHLHWYLIGRMPEIEWFTRELADHKASPRFHFSAPVAHDELASEVAKAKIGIIPLPDLEKFRNNIPQKLFELLALRIPVVMSNLPPSRNFVGDGACAIMVPPDRYDAYAEAIIRLVQDRDLRYRMGLEGRERVIARYNWDKESVKLVSLYTELLSGTR
jgi:glycosyltransferase involved in cell wall biosynthesis